MSAILHAFAILIEHDAGEGFWLCRAPYGFIAKDSEGQSFDNPLGRATGKRLQIVFDGFGATVGRVPTVRPEIGCGGCISRCRNQSGVNDIRYLKDHLRPNLPEVRQSRIIRHGHYESEGPWKEFRSPDRPCLCE